MSELTIKSPNTIDYVELMRKVAYTNHRSNPSTGQRVITISTKFTCVKKKNETKELPVAKILLNMKNSDEPTISVNGVTNTSRDQIDTVRKVMTYS